MNIYDVIEAFTKQFPYIMDGLKSIIAFIGLLIFVFSGKVLLTSTSNEKQARVVAWTGLLISPWLFSVEKWMNVFTATVYGSGLGPIYRVGADFDASQQNALMIFNATEIYIQAFGWFGFIGGIFKFIEAPRHNNPGLRRKAVGAMFIGMICANSAFTINVAGGIFGVKNAYSELKIKLTQ